MPQYIQINRVENGFIFGFVDTDSPYEDTRKGRVNVYPADRYGVEEMLDEIQSRMDIDDEVTEYAPTKVTRTLVTGYFTADELMDIGTNLRYNERGRVPTQCCEEGVAPGCCDVPLKESD